MRRVRDLAGSTEREKFPPEPSVVPRARWLGARNIGLIKKGNESCDVKVGKEG
jgi:hypothetical protein